MKKLLIMLVKSYPYDSGEPFLESEIEKHIPYYDKILVLSQDVSANSKQTRILPSGIDFAVTATGDKKKLRKKDLLNAPRLMLKTNDAIKSELKQRKLNFAQKGFLCYFESRCLRLLEESKAILKDVDVNQYDQITLYSYWLFANANVGMYLKDYLINERKFAGRIVLFTRAHRYDIYEEVNKLKYLPFRARLIEGMDKVFPCSADGTEYLKKRFPHYSSKIQTSYLGTRDYGISDVKGEAGSFHIVSCSRVVKVKGLERLIEDLSLLAPNSNVKWTHIGGGDEGKTDYFEHIKKYAEDKLKNISFEFIGAMSNQEVYEYYKNNTVDVFVNCSFSEGLPVSLMEASSFGIPVIATDVGGSKEIIDCDKNGFLLPCNFEKGQLSQKLEIMMNESSEEKANRRIAARRLWENCYCAEKNYSAFAEVISEL